MIAVSACLVGKNVKYDGTNNYNQKVIDYLKGKQYILICPETLGGLDTPRIPSEIIDGKVINEQGQDVTKYFEDGARKALELLVKNNVNEIILKSNSPSCGYKKIYDGTFSHTLIDGDGMFTKLLKKSKINILTERDL